MHVYHYIIIIISKIYIAWRDLAVTCWSGST